MASHSDHGDRANASDSEPDSATVVDRVANLRGRPRGSTAFAAVASAPQLSQPLDRTIEVVIPATQPPESSQPARGNRGRGRGRAAVSTAEYQHNGNLGWRHLSGESPRNRNGVELEGDNTGGSATPAGPRFGWATVWHACFGSRFNCQGPRREASPGNIRSWHHEAVRHTP